jgi:putative spermidine/putrescine transport system ATP-binding protein
MSANQQPFVKFDHVEKSYDGKKLVIQDLSLEIFPGEFLTLLGPSGSGKTTALMMLAGFENPTAGEIYLNGKPINRIAPEHRDIGMVFQNYALFPHMTVAANVAYGLDVMGMERGEKAARVAEMLGLVQMARLKPGQAVLEGIGRQSVAAALQVARGS